MTSVDDAVALPRRRRHASTLLLWTAVLLAVLVASVAASLAVGVRDVPLADVWRAVTGQDDGPAALVVRDQRWPRTAVALCAGLALGLAGTVVQAHTRNPLADPGLLGVTAGAAFAVCVGIWAFDVASLESQVWWALAGALLTSALVFIIGGTRSGSTTPITLALAGTAVTALLAALTSAILLLDTSTLDRFRFWTVGSVAGRGFGVLEDVAPLLVLGLVMTAIAVPGLNSLALGQDVATALGQDVARARLLGIGVVAVLTGAAVSIAGPLVFVGLVSPHVARAMTGPDYRWMLPLSGVIGAALVVAADTLGRRLTGTDEVQVGVVVALLGAPLFVVLVRRRRLVTV